MLEQIAISVFGITAAWLSMDLRVNYRKYACIFGLIGQPFWFYSAFTASQWGIFLLCFFYTASYFRGYVNYWVKGVEPVPDIQTLYRQLREANADNLLLEEQLKETNHSADYNFNLYQDLAETSFKTDNELLEYIATLEKGLKETKERLYSEHPIKDSIILTISKIEDILKTTKPSLLQENNLVNFQPV